MVSVVKRWMIICLGFDSIRCFGLGLGISCVFFKCLIDWVINGVSGGCGTVF